jgi:hypothetical protein
LLTDFFELIRVNDKPGFTFARSAGEFRLYVRPEGLKQKWCLPLSMRAKSKHMPPSSVLYSAQFQYTILLSFSTLLCTVSSSVILV